MVIQRQGVIQDNKILFGKGQNGLIIVVGKQAMNAIKLFHVVPAEAQGILLKFTLFVSVHHFR